MAQINIPRDNHMDKCIAQRYLFEGKGSQGQAYADDQGEDLGWIEAVMGGAAFKEYGRRYMEEGAGYHGNQGMESFGQQRVLVSQIMGQTS